MEAPLIHSEYKFRQVLECYNAKMEELQKVMKESDDLFTLLVIYSQSQQYKTDREHLSSEENTEYLLSEEINTGSKGISLQPIEEIYDAEQKEETLA